MIFKIKDIVRFSFFACVLWASACNQASTEKVAESPLPIIGQRLGTSTKTVNGKQVTDTIYHTVPDFKVVNQDGETKTSANFADDVYVANFFFTSCPSICPMTQSQMLKLQRHFNNIKDFKMISFSIDPRHDSISVLKDYSSRIGADTRQWQFVRGDEDQIYNLAQKGFMSSALKDSAAPGGFMHSGAFILVDKQKHIRGIYDGVDTVQVATLIMDIPRLFKEYHEIVKAQ